VLNVVESESRSEQGQTLTINTS